MRRSTPAEIRQALAARFETLYGVRALSFLPVMIPPDLPLVTISCGRIRYDYANEVATRVFPCRFHLATLDQMDEDELPESLDKWYLDVYDLFSDMDNLGLYWIHSISLAGDSGESVLTHAGESFFGTVFDVEVMYGIESKKG